MENIVTSLVLNNSEILKIFKKAEELLYLVINIPGKPQPYASPRKGKKKWYDPKAEIKEDIRWFIKTIYKGMPIKSNVQVGFSFEFGIPYYWPKKKKELAEKGEISHKTKPDIDNLIKLYLDCLKNTVIWDDSQVVKLFPAPQKKYSHDPKTIIIISEL